MTQQTGSVKGLLRSSLALSGVLYSLLPCFLNIMKILCSVLVGISPHIQGISLSPAYLPWEKKEIFLNNNNEPAFIKLNLALIQAFAKCLHVS